MEENNKRLILPIIITALITTFIVGFCIYILQQSNIEKLEEEIKTLSQIIHSELNEGEQDGNPSDPIDTSYPVVFAPPGLFLEEEKETLMEKLVKPAYDYSLDPLNLPDIDIISIRIEKEANINYYMVEIITKSKDDGVYGSYDFLYGSTRRDYGYWAPACVVEDICSFSDTYKEKYPEVVKEFNDCPGCFPRDIDM